MHDLTIALAQINAHVGALKDNTDKIIQYCQQAKTKGADIILFPELAICGYPPEDLLFRDHFLVDVAQSVDRIGQSVSGIDVVVGYPQEEDGDLYNVAGWMRDGKLLGTYRKQCLPNYSVFDEKRYFTSGKDSLVIDKKGISIGVTICEDIWQTSPLEQASGEGAEIVLNLNASPYYQQKSNQREILVKKKSQQYRMAVVYCNLVGGQDELVFDGGSFCTNSDGTLVSRSVSFEETLSLVRYHGEQKKFAHDQIVPEKNALAATYDALVLGVRDYVNKNGFSGAVLGLSGGIDSALTLAIAVDALGKDRVNTVAMPSRYTADMSNDDAAEQAKNMGVSFEEISIEPVFKAFLNTLEDSFSGTNTDTTEENIQARCRGIILMALSNKFGNILLTTGNKSEMSVGYATLYGDMAGGYAPIKDVPKTLVYQLAEYRNTLAEVIPRRVIDRPPSAELRPDQQDTDSLPDYDVLDDILHRHVERHHSIEMIVAAGHDLETVKRITRLVDGNEYKRKQAPPGVKITPLAFGRDRRFPITNGYK